MPLNVNDERTGSFAAILFYHSLRVVILFPGRGFRSHRHPRKFSRSLPSCTRSYCFRPTFALRAFPVPHAYKPPHCYVLVVARHRVHRCSDVGQPGRQFRHRRRRVRCRRIDVCDQRCKRYLVAYRWHRSEYSDRRSRDGGHQFVGAKRLRDHLQWRGHDRSHRSVSDRGIEHPRSRAIVLSDQSASGGPHGLGHVWWRGQ